MSRFYEALKEASRALDSSNANSGTPEAVPAEPAGLEKPEPLYHAEAPVAAVAAPPSSVSEAQPIGLTSTPEKAVLTENAEPGDEAAILLDHTAPLIPNAADAVVVEHYRRLRTRILQQQAIKPLRTLIIASPGTREGKTVTAMNLALSFGTLPNFRILLVDGDLRRGSVGKWVGVEDHLGLSNMLDGTATLEQAILKPNDTPVHFLLRGTSKLAAAELLHSSALSSHFRQMAELYDMVLVDSPPVNLITDTQLLASSCDAVLLVARAFATTRKALDQAVRDLEPYRVIGTVLNGGTRAQPYNRKRNSGYYER